MTHGPYDTLCIIFGCKWSDWIGPRDGTKGKKCKRCGRWKYDDGSTLPGVRNQ